MAFIFFAVFISCDPTTGNNNPPAEEKGFALKLSDFENWGGENSTYDKTAHKFSANSDGSAGLWLGNYDKSSWSEYNCMKINYSTEDYGFFFSVEYKDGVTIAEEFYCPSNMTEFIVPLNKELLSKIEQVKIYGCWNHNVNITLKSITLLNRENPGPSKTYTEQSVEKVIDNGQKKEINASISAWKFLPTIGTGFQYGIVSGDNRSIDFGYDISYGGLGYPIESEETIKQIHAKGFNTLRLQVTSGTHIIDDNYTINPAFIKQFKKLLTGQLQIICT